MVCPGCAIRSLRQTSLPRWSSQWSYSSPDGNASSVKFVILHDRSIDVIINNQRGEGFVKQVFLAVLGACAAGGGGSVIDIGSNTGFYSMLSAAHGCSVLAIDAQPGCAAVTVAGVSVEEALRKCFHCRRL